MFPTSKWEFLWIFDFPLPTGCKKMVGSNWVSFLKTPHISTHVKSKSELAGRCKRSSTPAARKTRNERAMKTYMKTKLFHAISSYHIHLMIQKLANRDCQYGDGSKPCTPSVHIKIAGIYGCSFPKNGIEKGIDPDPYGSFRFVPKKSASSDSDIVPGHFPATKLWRDPTGLLGRHAICGQKPHSAGLCRMGKWLVFVVSTHPKLWGKNASTI